MKTLHRLEDLFLVTLFLAALLALTAQLGSRYFLSYQFSWTEELARFLFTWIVFLGAANVMRHSGLIAVRLIPDRLPDGPRNIVAIFMHLLGGVFFAILTWVGIQLCLKVAALPTIAMGISSTFEYGAVPAGGALMAVRSFGAALGIWRDGLPRDTAETLM
ncbi:TRAP transporter small permease [uncultured Nitratireductor sp.]|uniref:TRAP transporter small permease n=1 Tax=uncultured Nitratireductor sp. TaxID=520953 RepID=UPI002605C2EE|nr:TRAP transporter small permease [uncultured Nitratireductor sp.]